MKTKHKMVEGVEEMNTFAKSFYHNHLGGVHIRKATVLALHGDLGGGKTTFVRALAHVLGIRTRVTSPTFVIQKSHKIPPIENSPFEKLIHVDAYRLEGGGEIPGLKEDLQDPKKLICIEWPENISEEYLVGAIHIYFIFIDEATRQIDFKPLS